MENKGKTTPNQPPIPRPVGFLYLYFPFVSSWLQVNYAKQTQFSQPQNHHNPFFPKDLPQYSAPSNEKKQSQNKPNPATPGKHRESSIHHQVSSPVFAKQTQCQNGQYKHKYSKNKGLCQRTTNNEQRTPFKTNPNKPNSPAPALHASRFTRYDIRHTKYEIRTLHNRRRAAII